ncbi:kinase-like protein [Gyrodon lividus]|nr:kinase-like protein [Gyrodon lividus]
MASGFAPLPALVSPWIEKGTLTKYLGGPGQGISRGERISILVKVAEALHYIHSENVVHGDLTGSNILIDDDGQPLISDFGLSSILKEHNETSYFKSRKPGSIRWAAPELLAKLPESPMLVEHNAPIENTSTAEPSIESDIYSYGCVMLHTLSGKIPYSEILHDIYVPLYIKVHGNSPQRPIDPPIGEMHWQMITNCLDVTPENRQKLTEVIASLRREG